MKKSAFLPADILIPKNQDFSKWSVVACDQFTSDNVYWEDVEKIVGTNPSTFRISLPEIFLEHDDIVNRINNINETMENYIKNDIFSVIKNSYIYIERQIGENKIRKGLIGIFDLDEYDFSIKSASLIRPTEGTVLDRIPPRVKIRENALLEMPHIMILIDDREKNIIENISDQKADLEKVYDFNLMKNGGHITGWQISSKNAEKIVDSLEKLGNIDEFNKKYNVSDKPLLMYAVGDGNHSLATAKTCWENIKKTLSEDEQKVHPAKYALAELVNLHDSSLEFEAIHRVLFKVNPQNILNELKKYYKNVQILVENEKINTSEKAHIFQAVINKDKYNIVIENPEKNLCVDTLQQFLDYYINNFGGKIDYIHGDDVVMALSEESPENMGFILPVMHKNELFKTVILDGVLPRKTFSMGHAHEKRYYLETRIIKK